jgi:methyl-accepting chemotaxis protein
MDAMNEDSASLRQLTVFERVVSTSVLLLLLALVGAYGLFSFCEARMTRDLRVEALSRAMLLKSLIPQVTPDALAKILNEGSGQVLLLDKKTDIIASNIRGGGWDTGRFNPSEGSEVLQVLKQAIDNPTHDNSYLRPNGELVYFFSLDYADNSPESKFQIVAVALKVNALFQTLQFLKIGVLSLLLLALGSSCVWTAVVMNREVRRPLLSLAQVLADLARSGRLETSRRELAELEESWVPHPRHELFPLYKAEATIIDKLSRLTSQARILADDRFEGAVLEISLEGDLADEHRRLERFMKSILLGLDALVSGDFEAELDLEALREDGVIGQRFQHLHGSVQMLIERLSQASDHLRASASKLQSSSSAQASAATKQAAGVTETMATMEELAASSGHIADTAKHVVTIAEQTLGNARNGQNAVENMGRGMEDIVKASLKGAERLLNLDEKSRSIGRVATLIAGVAEQSKILALNAAIEAAHAGEGPVADSR